MRRSKFFITCFGIGEFIRNQGTVGGYTHKRAMPFIKKIIGPEGHLW